MKGDSYSAAERVLLDGFRVLTAAALRPAIWLLDRLGVPPNAVSLSQIPLGVGVALLIEPLPRAAWLVFVATLLLDALDGALARRTGRTSDYGALIDQLSDHSREIIVVAGLAFAGALNGGLAALYAFSYPLFNFMLYVGSARGVRAPVAVKTWMVFYPFLFLYLWFAIDYLDLAAAVAVGVMLAEVAWQLWALRRRL